MEFGKHLGKGIWGLADKFLPVIYGLAYVLLVIRVLPEEEFGNFVLVQEIFLIITGLATALALQPLLKFASEDSGDSRVYVGIALILYSWFLAICSLTIALSRTPLGDLLNSPTLAPLLLYIPAMLLASFLRNFCLVLLQSRFRIKEVFWTDSLHFLGTPLLIWLWSRMHLFDSAVDLLNIGLISLTVSSAAGLFFARDVFVVRFSWDKDQVRKMWNYGSYSFGSTVSALMLQKADTFILASFTGPAQVAAYNAAKVFVRVYDMVMQVITMFILPAASKLSSLGESVKLKIMVEKGILFSTIGMMPILFLFLAFPSQLVDVLYAGRYADAIPVLRVFSLAALVVSAAAVGGNALMGLGHTRQVFAIGTQTLVVSVVAYFIFIPWLGGIGGALGYVCMSYLGTAITLRYLNKYVPITPSEVLNRRTDIAVFVRSRLGLLHKRLS